MGKVLIRTIILYFVILIVIRLMGKKEIGQMQPFEFVISIMTADIATGPLTDTNISLMHGIIPIVGIFLSYLFISICNMKSIFLRGIICGRPKILIRQGTIDEEALKKEKVTLNELQERLRVKDIFYLEDVEYAILETNGELSVILKPDKQNPCLSDLNIEGKYKGIPYELVIDGKIMQENLEKINKTYGWLKKEVNKFGYEPEEALIVSCDAEGNIFCQRKQKIKD